MMKKIVLLFSLAGALLLTACGPREIPAKGDFTVRVFDDTPVRFAPDIYPEAYNAVSYTHLTLPTKRIV